MPAEPVVTGVTREADVCVAIPTYNRSAILERLLARLLPEVQACATRTGLRLAVSVSDNASPDRTPEVLATAAAAYPLLRYERQERNRGATENFMRACLIQPARMYWLLSDDDDLDWSRLDRALQFVASGGNDYVILGAGHEQVGLSTGRVPADRLLAEFPFESLGHITRIFFSRRLIWNDGSAFRTRPEYCLYPQMLWLVELVREGWSCGYFGEPVILQSSFGSRAYWKLRHIVGRFLEFPAYVRAIEASLGRPVHVRGFEFRRRLVRDFLKYAFVASFVPNRWPEVRRELQRSGGVPGKLCALAGLLLLSRPVQALVVPLARRRLIRTGINLEQLRTIPT